MSKLTHGGGGEVMYGQDRGEWFVGNDVANTIANGEITVNYQRIFEGSSSISFQNVVDFSNGFANSVVTNHALGFGRMDLDNEAFEYGQFTGDLASVGMGIVEICAGGTIAAGGTLGSIVTSPTGVGAVAGATVAAGGLAIATEGAATTGTALANILDKHGRVHAQRGKGERGLTSKPSGTNSPFKKMKPDPNNPNKVLYKDPRTGKTVSKPKPQGFDNFWNKH